MQNQNVPIYGIETYTDEIAALLGLRHPNLLRCVAFSWLPTFCTTLHHTSRRYYPSADELNKATNLIVGQAALEGTELTVADHVGYRVQLILELATSAPLISMCSLLCVC